MQGQREQGAGPARFRVRPRVAWRPSAGARATPPRYATPGIAPRKVGQIYFRPSAAEVGEEREGRWAGWAKPSNSPSAAPDNVPLNNSVALHAGRGEGRAARRAEAVRAGRARRAFAQSASRAAICALRLRVVFSGRGVTFVTLFTSEEHDGQESYPARWH